MPRVTQETVAHVARLARLSLTDEEARTFTGQLDQVLQYAEGLQGIDTTQVEPMSHAQTAEIFREDQVAPGLARERVLGSAPDAADGLFRVPRVIGG